MELSSFSSTFFTINHKYKSTLFITYHKKVLENFEKFISQERYMIIWILSAFENGPLSLFYFILWMTIKIMKFFTNILQSNSDDERCLQKVQQLANFKLLWLHNTKFQHPTAWGLKVSRQQYFLFLRLNSRSRFFLWIFSQNYLKISFKIQSSLFKTLLFLI